MQFIWGTELIILMHELNSCTFQVFFTAAFSTEMSTRVHTYSKNRITLPNKPVSYIQDHHKIWTTVALSSLRIHSLMTTGVLQDLVHPIIKMAKYQTNCMEYISKSVIRNRLAHLKSTARWSCILEDVIKHSSRACVVVIWKQPQH